MAQQTAVMKLLDYIIKQGFQMEYEMEMSLIDMEKEQIVEAYRTGVEEDVYNNPLKTGDQYYNETYGKQEIEKL